MADKAAVETIRRYLTTQDGRTEATLGHLLSTFDVGAENAAGRARIQVALAEAGVRIDRGIDRLSKDDLVVLTLADHSTPQDPEPAPAAQNEPASRDVNKPEPEEGAAGLWAGEQATTRGRPSDEEQEKRPPAKPWSEPRTPPSPTKPLAAAPAGPTQGQSSPQSPRGENVGEPPVRICRKCSAQARTFDSHCPNCGASYLRGMKQFSRRAKTLAIGIPLAILLLGGGTGVALKLRHDHNVEQQRKERAAKQRARERAQRKQEAAKRAADDAIRKTEISTRKELVTSLEKSVTKDARSRVAEGVLDGPILRTQCEASSGGPEDTSNKHGAFDCTAVHTDNADGTSEGYRFSATIDYDKFTYRWNLGD